MDCPARSGLGHAKPARVRLSLEANKGPLPGEGVRGDRPETGRGAEGKGGDPSWRWAGRKRKAGGQSLCLRRVSCTPRPPSLRLTQG